MTDVEMGETLQRRNQGGEVVERQGPQGYDKTCDNHEDRAEVDNHVNGRERIQRNRLAITEALQACSAAAQPVDEAEEEDGETVWN